MKHPKPHQVDFAHFHNRTGPYSGMLPGLLGDTAWHGMGLGKTLSALWEARKTLAHARAGLSLDPRFMVICPKSAVSTWKVECYAETPDIMPKMHVYPYSQLHNAIKALKYFDFKLIVFDESHKVKGTETDRIKHLANFMRELGSVGQCFRHGRVILATGTPLPNHAGELYTTWAMCAAQSAVQASEWLLDQKRINEWKSTFANKIDMNWVIGKGKPKAQQRMGHATKLAGVNNTDMLQKLLAPIVHYVPIDKSSLPVPQIIPVQLNLPDDILLKDADLERPEAYMSLLERLARAKTPHMLQWAEDFVVSQKTQLVVFAMNRAPLEQLKAKYPNKVRLIVGSGEGSSTADRARNLKDFQEGRVQILAMTYAAGAESLNCQNCNYALYLGYPWNAASLDQAMARIYRTGQDKITYHYFLTSGENDTRNLERVEKKRETTQAVERMLLESRNGLVVPGPKKLVTLDDFI